MKTTVKLARLSGIAFAMPGRTSLVETLYTTKPQRGGSKIAYRIASLRATSIRLLGDGSAFAQQRDQIMDEYFDAPESEGGERKPKNGPASIDAANTALAQLFAITEEIDVELFSVDAIDAAGYFLSGAEIDALTGLLIQPESGLDADPVAQPAAQPAGA